MFSDNSFVRVVSYVTIGIVCSIFLFEIAIFCYAFVYKILIGIAHSVVWGSIATAVALSLWIIAFWSYLRCSLSDPGVVDEAWNTANTLSSIPPALPLHRGDWRWTSRGGVLECNKCDKKRPERAHHCSVCGRCILRMDHHCPWIGNCVGFGNHKFFVLFCFWTFFTCLTMAASSAPWVVKSISQTNHSLVKQIGITNWSILLLGWILWVTFAAACLVVLGMQLWFASRNRTTIESVYIGENPYDLGRKRNFEQIFGRLDWKCIVPIPPRRPVSDGYSFPTVDNCTYEWANKANGSGREDAATTSEEEHGFLNV